MGLTDLRLIRRREIGPMMSVACDPALERYATIELLAKGRVGRRGRRPIDGRRPGALSVATPRRRDFGGPALDFSPDGQYLLCSYDLSAGGSLNDVWHLGRRERVFRQRSRGLSSTPTDGG